MTTKSKTTKIPATKTAAKASPKAPSKAPSKTPSKTPAAKKPAVAADIKQGAAPSHKPVTPKTTPADAAVPKPRLLSGVVVSVVVFAGLLVGAGATLPYWWPNVEPLLPRSNFESNPLVAKLQDRVEVLESSQLEKVAFYQNELSAFKELEKERVRMSQELVTAIARLESVEASVRNVEKMALAVSSTGAAGDARLAINQLSERLNIMELQTRESLAVRAGDDGALSSIAKRVDALESVEGASESDNIVRASALVLAVGQLRTVVREGRPYSAELDAVAATADQTEKIRLSLDTLARRAVNGVVQMPAIRTTFEEAILKAIRANSQIAGDGWITEVLNKLSGLVTIRKIDGSAGGSSVDDQIAQAQASLSDGDLMGVIAVVEALDEPAAEVFAPWLEDARTYLTTEQALDDLYGHVISLLSSAQG